MLLCSPLIPPSSQDNQHFLPWHASNRLYHWGAQNPVVLQTFLSAGQILRSDPAGRITELPAGISVTLRYSVVMSFKIVKLTMMYGTVTPASPSDRLIYATSRKITGNSGRYGRFAPATKSAMVSTTMLRGMTTTPGELPSLSERHSTLKV